MRFNLRRTKTIPEATLDLPEVGPRASLRGRLATEANPPYYNAMLKLSSKRLREVARGRLSAEMIAKNRGEDATLYPRFVITGWTGIEDESGAAIEFSVDACTEFLAQLTKEASWIFDRVRNFFGSPENFLADEDLPPEGEVVAKN